MAQTIIVNGRIYEETADRTVLVNGQLFEASQGPSQPASYYAPKPGSKLFVPTGRLRAPELLIPGRKPAGEVELIRPIEGFYWLMSPNQMESIADFKNTTIVGLALANGATFDVDNWGPHLRNTANTASSTGMIEHELARQAQTGGTLFVEFCVKNQTGSGSIVAIGGTTNGFASVVLGFDGDQNKLHVNTYVGSLVQFISPNFFGGTDEIIRVGFVVDNGIGTVIAKNLVTGDIYTETQATGTYGSNTGNFDIGDNTDPVCIYNMWWGRRPWPIEVIRNLVMNDPYQILKPRHSNAGFA